MQKQDDVKSQTSGPFALTLQGIKGYGQLNQHQLDNQTNNKAKFSFEEKKTLACMSLHVF